MSRDPVTPWRASQGQSLVEFSLVLPVLLVLVLMAVDFGRGFYAWVTLTNAVRDAANYAGMNPGAGFGIGSAYNSIVLADGLQGLRTVCMPLSSSGQPVFNATGTQQNPIPAPVFSDGPQDANTTPTDLGDRATVTISCDFRVITPVVSSLIGTPVRVSAASTFTIRVGPYQP
jgi:hypothetical protein